MANSKRDTVIFGDECRHDRHRFAPGIPIRFEGAGVAGYFEKAGWAEFSSEEPKMTFTAEEVTIDPETINHATGLKVMDASSNQEA